QLAQGDERRFLEKVFEGRLGALRLIDDAACQAVQQRPRREIDHDHLVRLLEDPVRNRLAHADAGALPDLIVEALEVLHRHRRQHVDAVLNQDLYVLPPLEALRPGHVGVRELVDDRDLRMPPEDGVRVHLLELCATIVDDLPRNGFEALAERNGLLPAGRLEVADADVQSGLVHLTGLAQHLIGLADTRGVPEKDLEPAAASVGHCGNTRTSIPSASRMSRSSGVPPRRSRQPGRMWWPTKI